MGLNTTDKTLLFLTFFLLSIYFWLFYINQNFFGADSFYFLSIAEQNNGLKFHNFLRTFPAGTQEGTNYFSVFLAGFSVFWGLSIQQGSLIIFLFLLTIIFCCFFYLCFFALKTTRKSLFCCFLLFLNPFFNNFLYYDTHLLELLLLLLGLVFLTVFWRKRDFVFGVSCFSVFLILFFLRPVSYSLTRFQEIQGFGVAELHFFLGLPFRFWFFLLPFLTIFFVWLIFKIQKTQLWGVFFVFFVLIIMGFSSLLPNTKVFSDKEFLSTAEFLRTREFGVVLDWWSYGYAWQFLAKKPVFWDGGTFQVPEKSFLSSFYLDTPQNSSVWLKSLLKDKNETIVYVVSSSNYFKLKYLMERFNNNNLKFGQNSLLFFMLNRQNIEGFELVFSTSGKNGFVVYKTRIV